MKIAGAILLAISGVLLLLVPVTFWLSFQSIANSPVQPQPSDLADEISKVLLFTAIAMPVGLLGLVLLVLGFVLPRRPER